MSPVAEIGRGRIVLAAGRISERLTARPLATKRIALTLLRGAGERELALAVGFRDAGWYALSLSQLVDLPVVPAAEPLGLRLDVELFDGRSASAVLNLTGADLARVTHDAEFGTRGFPTVSIAGAPFRIDCSFDPKPVLLEGVVLEDNDPLSPAVGAELRAGALIASTDVRGAFRLGPLPLVEEIEITVDHASTETVFTLRPDYSQTLNRTEFSVSP